MSQRTQSVMLGSTISNPIDLNLGSPQGAILSPSIFIILIADMNGVGVVWFYPEGVANVLSQYRMAVFSRWEIKYDTDINKDI